MTDFASVLGKQRSTIEGHRLALRRRESVRTAVSTVTEAVRTRRDRIERKTGPRREVDRIVGYLEDLLDYRATAPAAIEALGIDDWRDMRAGERADETGASPVEFLEGIETRHIDPENPLSVESSGDIDATRRAIGREFEGLTAPDGPNASQPFPKLFNRFTEDRIDSTPVLDLFRRLLTEGTQTDLRRLSAFFADVRLRANEGVSRVEADLNSARDEYAATLERADAEGVDPVAELDLDLPIVTLPVRLETRFVDSTDFDIAGPQLRIRVFPDQIHVDTHEESLTGDEQRWGREFWAQIWFACHAIPQGATEPTDVYDPGKLPNDRLRGLVADLFAQREDFSEDPFPRYREIKERAWQRGVERYGSERAAYVVHELGPDTTRKLDERLLMGWDEDGTRPWDNAPIPALEFPAVGTRPESWTEAPTARLLPDRWLMWAYWEDDQGTERVTTATSSAVREPLRVGPDPSSRRESSGPMPGEAADWMVDYEKAEGAGMAVSIDLPPGPGFDSEEGFSRVIVAGVRTSQSADRAVEELEDILEAKHYTDGLAFLKPGTATNNTRDEGAGRSTKDDHRESLSVEVDESLIRHDFESDGERVARALGIQPEADEAHPFAHVENAGAERNREERHVNSALWPGTWGYYIKNMLVPWAWGAMLGGTAQTDPTEVARPEDEEVETEHPPAWTQEGVPGDSLLAWVAAYREQFVEHVRSAGPLATLRTGAQPYGVLPVTALDVQRSNPPDRYGWRRSSDEEEGETSETGTTGTTTGSFDPERLPEIETVDLLTSLAEWVWRLQGRWRASADAVPSITGDSVEDSELMAILRQSSTPTNVRRQRWLTGRENPVWDVSGARFESQETRIEYQLARLGVTAPLPRIAMLAFTGGAEKGHQLDLVDELTPRFARLLAEMIAGADESHFPWALRALGTVPTAEHLTVPELSWGFRRETLLDDDVFPSYSEVTFTSTRSLVRQVLRFATVRECIACRQRLGELYDDPIDYPPDPTAYGPADENVFDRLRDPIEGAPDGLGAHPRLAGGRDTYERAIARAIAEGETGIDPRMAAFEESLQYLAEMDPEELADLSSAALDLCSTRLDAWWTSIATRRLFELREEQPGGERGVHIGAVGYLENVTEEPGEDGEYLVAPSMNQATTATVLRSAHRQNEGTLHGSTLGIDLSPSAVRRARPYLDGIRNGHSLSELFGYRFERELRERGLGEYIHPFRELAPGLSGRMGREDRTESVATSDVVDGMALYRRFHSDDPEASIPWGGSMPSGELPAPGTRDLVDVTSIFTEFRSVMTAVSDLYRAESVHQLGKGNPGRAAAATEALSRAKEPPHPEVIDTPRDEVGVSHRLLVMFGDATDTDLHDRAWAPEKRPVIDHGDLPGVPRDVDALYSNPYLDHESLLERLGLQPETDTVAVRHEAEENLNVWAADVLPDPSRVSCRAEFQWSESRQFQVGAFRTPAEPGVLNVTDVGFEPDLVLLSVTLGVETTKNETTSGGGSGWTHGKVHSAPDGTITQNSIGAAVDESGSVTAYAGSTSAALDVPFVTDRRDGSTVRGSVTGRLTRTTEEGFEMEFPTVEIDGRLVVEYTAIRTGDGTAVSVGHTTAPASRDGIPLGVNADHVQLTACTAVGDPNVAGTTPTGGAPPQFSHGAATVHDDGSVDQYAIGVGTPADGHHVAAAEEDAALALFERSGSALTGGLLGQVEGVRETDDRYELGLTYSTPSSGSYGADEPLISYVAYETSDEKGREAEAPPALGVVRAPDSSGATVSATTGFEPACVELIAAPSVRGGPNAGESISVSTLSDGSGGWSHGVASGVARQRALGASIAPGRRGGGVASGAAGDAVSAVQVTQDGSPGTVETARLAGVRDDGFDLLFPEIDEAAADDLLVFYRAWPKRPTERAYAVEASVSLDALDLTPLDMVSLTQETERAGDSQLERRIGYHLFRFRPDHRPSVPDDAELELTFAETGPGGGDVSMAACIEVARSLREVVADGRAADAEDLTHPAEGAGNGYIESGPHETAVDLRERANTVQDKLAVATTIVNNRIDILDPEQGTSPTEQVDRVEAELADFERDVPVFQIRETVDALAADHPGSYTGTDPDLLSELEALAITLRAGPTDRSDPAADVVVERGDPTTIEGTADVDGKTELDVEIRSLTDSRWVRIPNTRVETDADGSFSAEVDVSDTTGDVPHGGMVLVTARPVGPTGRGSDEWWETLVDELAERDLDRYLLYVVSALSPRERRELLETLADDESTEDEGLARLDRWGLLTPRDRLRTYVMLDRVSKVTLLRMLGDDAAADYFSEGEPSTGDEADGHVPEWSVEEVGEGTSRAADVSVEDLDPDRNLAAESTEGGEDVVFAATVRIIEDDWDPGAMAATLSEQAVVPRLLWLYRVLEDLRPVAESPGEALQSAVRDADWDAIADEETLIRAVRTVVAAAGGGSSERILTAEDVAAVESLVDLRDLDLAALAAAIDRVLAPLRRCGVTDLLDLGGELDRPGDQRFFRTGCSVGWPLGKHCEGEVRTRLIQLAALPDIDPDAPDPVAGYATEFQRFIANRPLDGELLFGVETVSANAGTYVSLLSEHMNGVDELVADLHTLLYHPKQFDGSPSELGTRLSAFSSAWLTNDLGDDVPEGIDNPDGFARALAGGGLGTLVAFARSLAGPSPDRHEARDEFTRTFDSWLSGPTAPADDLASVAATQIGAHLRPAIEAGDLAERFRLGVLESLRRGLFRATYFGLYGATPRSAAGGTPEDERQLIAQGEAVAAKLDDRLSAALELDPRQPHVSDEPTVRGQIDRIQTLLTDRFVVLPYFAPTNPAEISAAFAASDSLIGPDEHVVDTWLQRAARVRERPATFRTALSYGDALAMEVDSARDPLRTLTVGQVPATGNWIGRDDTAPTGGELSFVAQFVSRGGRITGTGVEPLSRAPGRGSNPPVAGLFVDGWTQRMAADTQTVGVGLRYDDPDSRPPQSILLAVPPRWTADEGTTGKHWTGTGPLSWTTDDLRTTITETIDLVKTRPVDVDTVEGMGHLLPALTFPENRTTLRVDDAALLPDAPSVSFDALDWEEVGE